MDGDLLRDNRELLYVIMLQLKKLKILKWPHSDFHGGLECIVYRDPGDQEDLYW